MKVHHRVTFNSDQLSNLLCVSARNPPTSDSAFPVNLRKNCLNALAICVIVMGMLIAFYFMLYAT